MPASPVPKSTIVTGSGTGFVVAGCAPPMRICATSSTFVTTIATVVVNATLLIRCPLMAVMVKKFCPLAPSANVPEVVCPLFSVTRKVTDPAVAASVQDPT